MKILISGGSRGIGKAIAQQCAKAHHDLLLISRNSETLNPTVQEIAATSHSKVHKFICDVGDLEQLTKLHDFCVKSNFLPEVLVLNAGIFIEGLLVNSPLESFEETFRVNFMSIYNIVRLFIEELKTYKAPKVILIGSTAAYEAYPIGPLYSVAKWALRGYAINLRKELVKDGIAVTFISPGGTLTDLWAGEELPTNRLLQPDDIGKLVVAILSLSDQAVVEELIVRPILGDIHE